MSKKLKQHLILGLLLMVFGVMLLDFVTGLNQSARANQLTSTNLLKNYNWSNMAGATVTPHGIGISALDRNIVQQDGSGGQTNPPVNLAGPRLSFSSDLIINASMQDFQDGSSFRLYGDVPIIYDEWRFEPPSLEFKQVGKQLVVNVWDGKAAEPLQAKTFNLTSDVQSLIINRQGNRATISVNGRYVGSLSVRKVFDKETIYFGLDAKSDWMLTNLTALAPNGLQVREGLASSASNTSEPTLQSLASKRQRPIKIGAAVALNPLLTDDNYRALALGQFSMWTPENELKPQFIHPQPNTYDFKEADLLVSTALKNNIAVHGHALVFGEANPRWMQNAPLNQKQQIMTDHITNVMTHYGGKVSGWDVINEPLSDDDADYASGGDGLRKHIWYQAMGKDYIAIALKTAKLADPNAKLYINDYGLEEDGDRWDALIELIKQLQSQGVPLDGIGFEAHVYEDGDHIDPRVLQRHIRQLAKLGLASRISEIDVHGENASYQAKEYSGVLTACLNEPACVAFSTWGITDRYGSTTDIGTYPLSYGNDLIWSK
ncbi:MAG: endo-1,4-beta-xylanase, partial [Patescibacteria group bacterium]